MEEYETSMAEWGKLAKCRCKEKEISEVSIPIVDDRYYRGADLEDDSKRKVVAERLHRNMGDPSWAQMSHVVGAVDVPQKLYNGR